jgi:4'-phosphopantetheinyl transferase
LILAKELNVNPLDLLFIKGLNNKPGLTNDSAYFNISHTREAFAIVISRHHYVGIDLEELNFSMNFHPIIKTFFSPRERQFILQSDSEAVNRFFLLWTRKEALLKALGTGIMDILTHVEVSEQENLLDKEFFDSEIIDSACNEHFIYSMVMGNNYLSIAAPCNAIVNINHLDNETVLSLLELKNII